MTGETPNPLALIRDLIPEPEDVGDDERDAVERAHDALAQVEALAEAAREAVSALDETGDPFEAVDTPLRAALVPFAAREEKPYHPDDDASDYIE